MKRRISIFALLLSALAAVGPALPVQAFNFYLFSNHASTFVDCYGAGSPDESTEELPTEPKSWSTEDHLTIKANELSGYRFLGWYTKEDGWGSETPTVESVDDEPFVTTPEITGAQIHSAGTASGLPVIVAKYIQLHTLTLAVNPAGAGTVGTNQVSVKTIIVEDGGSVTLTATANAGWKFEKWDDGVTTNPRTISNVRASATYTAAFSAQFKTVTLQKCGGTGGTDSVVVTNGMAPQRITVPTRTGYDFKGYFTSETGDGATQYYTSDGQGARAWDATEETNVLYARWKGKEFYLEFNDQGADKKSGQGTKMVVYGENPGPVAIPTKSNYTFIGYFYNDVRYWDENGTWNGGVWTASDRTVEIFARYQADSYTIKFDRNGGTEGAYTDLIKDVDEQFALPDGKAFSYERHVFAGWALSEGGEKKFDGGATTKVADNISSEPPNPKVLTFYAVWTDLSRTVRFNAGSAEATVIPQTKLVTAGEPFGELATATWPGERCTLAGWWNKAGEEITADSIVPESAGIIDLTARWTTNGYTVVFHENGGTGEMGDQKVPFYETVSLVSNRFVRAGYHFIGWATNETDVVTYADGAEVRDLVSTKDEKANLYAKWAANDYQVGFFGNGGTNEMAVQSFTYDVEQALMSNRFVREGFVFAGWATDPTNDVAYGDGAKVLNLTTKKDATVRLFAKWTAKSGEISKWSKALGCDNLDIETTEDDGITVKEGGSGVRIDVKKTQSSGGEWVRGLTFSLCEAGKLTANVALSICENPNEAPDYASRLKLTSDNSRLLIKELAKTTNFVQWTWQREDAEKKTVQLVLETCNDYIKYGMPSDSDNDYAEVLSVRWEPAVTNASWVGVTFRTNDGTMAPEDIYTNVTCQAGEAYGELPVLADKESGAQFLGWVQSAGASSFISPDWIVPADSEGTQLHAVWSVVTNAVPAAIAGLVYDGTAKTGVAAGKNYTLVGNVATNAGDYVATATLTDGVWEGGSSAPTNIAWTIAKGTKDVSGITFPDATFKYDGKEHTFGIVGDLPAGVSVVYDGETRRTEVGTNTVTASFVVADAANWNEIATTLTAKLVITPKEDPPGPTPSPVVTNAVPAAVPGLVYNGGAQTGVAAGAGYVIVGNVGTNAGLYVAMATVTNGVWEGGATGATNIAWTIAKATYDMSGVIFTNETYEADGSAKSVLVSGVLPSGVTVSYEGNGRTEPGTYTVTAKFAGDATNYEPIADKTAILTIAKKEDPPVPPDPTVAYENIFFRATLAELGAGAVPTDRKITIKAEGLPRGLKLVTTALNGTYAYVIEGVPTELMDGTSRIAYVRVTDNKVQTLHALSLSVRPAAEFEVKEFPDAEEKSAYVNFSVAKLWPDVAANPKNWTFSGWPSGIRYTARETKEALPYEIYGTPTKAGCFTVKAVEKIGGTSYKSTHVATFTVWPQGQIGEIWTDQAYVAVSRASEKDVTAASGLPTGVKFAATDVVSGGVVMAKAHTFYGTPTKAGTFVVTLSRTAGLKSKFIWTIMPAATPTFELQLTETEVDPSTRKATIRQGVRYDWAIDCTPGAAVTARGLPAGLKLVKTAAKSGNKTVGYTYSVGGVPTKAGEFLVMFTTKLNGVSQVTTTAFTVLDLPAWAQGTFDGGADETFPVGGQSTLTVSKAGKLSGKWMSEGTIWTLSAASYDRYDEATASYVVHMIGKTGSGKNVRVFTNEVSVAKDAVGGVATSEIFLAYQNNWNREPWKTLGKTIAKAPAYEFRPYADAGDDHTNDTVSLKFSASGKVSVKASYFKSISGKGKISWTTVSGSATLCPQSLPEGNAFPAVVFVYLQPKNGTPIAGKAYATCVFLSWDGQKFVEWTDLD